MKNKTRTHEDFSIILTKIALFLALIVGFWLTLEGPFIVRQIMLLPGGYFVGRLRFYFLLISGYMVAVIGVLCIYYLYKLVNNIGHEIVFVAENVRYLQIIGWLTLSFTIIALACGFTCYDPIQYLGYMAGFMFLIIRVVRNIFGKAVEMQNELDYTV